MGSDSSENTIRTSGTDAKVYYERGDCKVACIKEGIVVKCAVLPSIEEANKFAECWRKGLDYVYV